MNVSNVHERELHASPQLAGGLIDSLASVDDRLWPKHCWPRMEFDRPLANGARGGHGPVRYFVEEFVPGEAIQFQFTGPAGFNGFHRFDLVAAPEGKTVLRHTLQMRACGRAALSWPLIFRPLHDALIEDALTTAEASLGQPPQLRGWSLRVRLLRWLISGGRVPRQRLPVRRCARECV